MTPRPPVSVRTVTGDLRRQYRHWDFPSVYHDVTGTRRRMHARQHDRENARVAYVALAALFIYAGAILSLL